MNTRYTAAPPQSTGKLPPFMNGSRPFFMRVPVFLALWTLLALLLAFQEYEIHRLVYKRAELYNEAAAWLVHFYLWAALVWFVWKVMPHFSLEGNRWKRDLLFHVPFGLTISVLELAIYVELVKVLRVAPPETDFQKLFLWNLNTDLPTNFFIYWTFVAIFRGVDYYERYRDRELRASQLEGQLAKARLQALKAQLDPHFFFNTMNSISSLMHRDIEKADAMIAGLSNLFRLNLQRGDEQEVTLGEEMEFLEQYLELQQLRFGSRIKIDVRTDPELHDVLVPSMVLQPLVENAMIHGVASSSESMLLEITAREHNGMCRITIYNSGSSLPENFKPGLGIANTRARLQWLYGEKSSLQLNNLQAGGVLAEVKLPLRKRPSQRLKAYDPREYSSLGSGR
jgi:two-component system, LytTR family, sensor kinase